MDKLKGNRPYLPTAKGAPTDSKNNNDALGCKPLSRGGRRREPAGGSFAPKAETLRKPQSQRARGLDKRPRTRGAFLPGGAAAASSGGRDTTRLDTNLEPELGSVFVRDSKKQSLNHLLNFHYAPRECSYPGGGHAGWSPTAGHKWLSTSKHKYNKEHFIQANCQFIVHSSGDYKQYMSDADALVDWGLIEQINLQVDENPSCPICLYPPSAAKMTRCGHIYCWSCMLHYLALSEKSWSKCPICYEAIHLQDLKSVVAVSHASFNVNETITFKLMKRARGSLIAYPIDMAVNPGEETFFAASDAQSSNVYSKLLIAASSDIMSIIEREKRQLGGQLCEQIDASERCFIEQAIAKLQEREDVLFASLQQEKRKVPQARERRERFESTSSSCDVVLLGGEEQPQCESSEVPSAPPVKYFYFYQAADGSHIYMHSVNVRMLERAYGSLECSPRTVTGRILEKEGGSMTEELRNRLRYLQHLPLTCQFEVAEIQLQASCVSREIADEFAEQLELRKKRRQKRAREEKRRERRIAEEENRQMGKIAAANIELESEVQFPEFGAGPEVRGRVREPSESTTRSASPEVPPGPSFAKMLAAKRQQPLSWPQLKSPVESIRLINVAGAKDQASISANRASSADGDSDECECCVPAPEYNRSFSDAIAMALEKASLANDAGPAVGDCTGGKKKKKKNKQRVLFATTMAYCGN